MRFDSFIASIDQLRSIPKPGDEAHFDILPQFAKERKLAQAKDENPKLSGVASILFNKEGETHVLLIERQSYDGVHSGQIGFPGGRKEEGDEDFEVTARRETEEEVGIPQADLQLITKLSSLYIPPSRFLVHPFLFFVEELPPLKIQEREVKQAFSAPLSTLFDEGSLKVGPISLSNGLKIESPYFAFQGHQIWGATAMMLNELRYMLNKVNQ